MPSSMASEDSSVYFPVFAKFVTSFVFALCSFSMLLFCRQNNMNATELPNAEHGGSFVLRRRILVWLKQMMLLLGAIFSLVSAFESSWSTQDFIGHLLSTTASFLLLNADGTNNISKKDEQFKWISIYLLMILDSVVNSLFLQSWSSYVSLSCCGASVLFAVLALFVEFKSIQVNPPTPEFTCGIFDYLTFSYLNELLILPGVRKKILEFDDIPTFSDADSSEPLWERFKLLLNQHRTLKLRWCAWMLVFEDWLASGFFNALGSFSVYLSPLALQIILWHVGVRNNENVGEKPGLLPVSVEIAALILFLGPFMKSIGDGQNYVRGRHIGLRVKSALISAVFKKALRADLTASKQSTGKLSNLISVDVSCIQELCCYSHYIWCTPLEITVSCTLLVLVLGFATAATGFCLLSLSIWFGLYMGNWIGRIQSELLKCKDIRMNITGEVLNSIRVIKYYAWELMFAQKISDARKDELLQLVMYGLVNALLHLVWDTVPTVVAAFAFVMHTYIRGQELTTSTGFTALALFNLLRFPLVQIAETINLCARANISMGRIHDFLTTADVKGLPRLNNNTTTAAAASVATAGAIAEPGTVKVSNLTLKWNAVQLDSSEGESKGGTSLVALSSCRFPCCDITSVSLISLNPCCRSRGAPVASSPLNNGSSGSASSAAAASRKPMSKNQYEKLSSEEDDRGLEMADLGDEEADVSSRPSPNTAAVPKQQENVLENVNFEILPKQLVVVIGMTGSGKSTLLQGGLLGECVHNKGGVVELAGSVSYVSQSPWIQNATLRDNILFGNDFDQERYDKVLFACALLADLKLLPAGDQTEIGEKGINLSGGQQQRVNLARAAYAKSDIILLDDPLSAVDAHVGDHIFKELISGFLKDRTRILVSHNIFLSVPSADVVLCTDQVTKQVIACCPPRQLPTALSGYLASSQDETASSFWQNVSEMMVDEIAEEEEARRAVESGLPAKPSTPRRQRTESIEKLAKSKAQEQSLTSLKQPSQQQQASSQIVATEAKSAGEVPLQMYWYYIRCAGGFCAVFNILFPAILISCTWLFQNYALGQWMLEMESGLPVLGAAFYLYMFSIGFLVLCAGYKNAAMVKISIRGATVVHDNILRSVLFAPCSWFDATPIGRIVNRFNQDISTVDMTLIFHIAEFLNCAGGTLQILFVVAYCLPWLLLPFIPIILFTAWVARQYLLVSREMKRWESIKKSPLFVLFSESLQGMSVIRAFRKESQFFALCCQRVDEMNRCHLYLWCCNRWLNFRMQQLGALVAGAVGFGVIYFGSHLSSSTAGIVIVYSMSFCDFLTFLARTHADVQMDMNSVERLHEYSELPPEKYKFSGTEDGSPHAALAAVTRSPPSNSANSTPRTASTSVGSSFSIEGEDDDEESHLEMSSSSGTANGMWPTQGDIEFRNVSMQYRTSTAPVLRNISFAIEGRTKIGVVGRTGAGKSSLISALFRLVEPSSGAIYIDGRNTLDMPLHQLRNAIAIVPQEPTLFKGSVRFNLDPFKQHSDEELWKALASVHMDAYVASMKNITAVEDPRSKLWQKLEKVEQKRDANDERGSLDHKQVTEKGGNFSAGQRQLLCLARAILRHAKVLVLDECTASVDHETDALIQDTVRHHLRSSTVLCIAHRLHTVAYYDKVLVMDRGEVAEFDAPYALLQNPKSIFYGMCQSSGDFEELYETAKNSFNRNG